MSAQSEFSQPTAPRADIDVARKIAVNMLRENNRQLAIKIYKSRAQVDEATATAVIDQLACELNLGNPSQASADLPAVAKISAPTAGNPSATDDPINTHSDQGWALRKERWERARKDMVIGALFCIGGILVTLFSYSSAASSPKGGSYIIAWGAIVFGAIQFIRGMLNLPQ